MNKSIIALSLFIVSVMGCEVYKQDEYEEYYVVESYLVAGRNLQQVRLSTTAPAFEFYSFENTAVPGATVQVQLLAENGTAVDQTFDYTMTSSGIYLPDVEHTVLPSRTYQLSISIPEGTSSHTLSGQTIVPGDFSILAGIQDTLVYQSTEQLEVTFSESSYPGRQNVYIFNTLSEEPIVENLTPLYFDFYDGQDTDEEAQDLLVEFSNTSSGLLNEANFTQNTDGTVTIRYPWLAVAFFGNNKIVASTIDENIFDYIRSASVQLGGSTLSPGEIQNVITNIEGGIGIFGAVASDTIQTFIKPPEFFKGSK